MSQLMSKSRQRECTVFFSKSQGEYSKAEGLALQNMRPPYVDTGLAMAMYEAYERSN